MTGARSPLRLGIIGAGGFATFLASAVRDLPAVRVTAVADADLERADRLARILSARSSAHWRALISGDDVDAVVIATPPAAHAEVAMAALRAGRHVFCEKPLAIDEADAASVRAAAARSGLVVVVDHVLRYNPILRAIQRLRDPLLGPVQRFAFENDASDEDLPPEHWFWDERVSGGIFVEHGVHFFDAACALIGSQPDAVQGMVARRPGTDTIDVAVATSHHPGGVLATFAHGFTHARRCERQLMRIDFGAVEARITGWIPVHAVLHGWTDEHGATLVNGLPARAAELLAIDGYRPAVGQGVEVVVDRAAGRARARARGLVRELPHRIRITIDLGGEPAKKRVYAQSVRAAMNDLVTCIRTGAAPAAGSDEGSSAVVVAAAARRSARERRVIDVGPLPACPTGVPTPPCPLRKRGDRPPSHSFPPSRSSA